MALGRHLGRGIKWFEKRLLAELATIGFAVLLARGALSEWSWTAVSVTLALAAILALKLAGLARRFSPKRINDPLWRVEILQLELVLLCATFLLIHMTGRMDSPLYPVLFVLLAAAGGFDASVFNRITIVVAAIVFEVLTVMLVGIQTHTVDLLVHLLSICGFPFLVGTMEWAWTASERKRREAQVLDRLNKAEQEADEYRLSGMTSVGTEMPLEKRREDLKRSSVKQVGISMANVLDVLEAALRPHAVAVYWLSMNGESVSLKAARPTDVQDLIIPGPMEARTGLIGAILKSKEPVRRNNLRKADRGLTYYNEKIPIKTFVGVPLLEGEGQHLRGVLLADRRVDVPFAEDDERLMQVAAGEILRTLDTEQKLNLMDQLRNEARGLYQSTEGLIEAVSVQDVTEEVAHSLREIFKGADFAAVILQEGERTLVIKAVDAGESFAEWKKEHVAREIPDSRNLCSLAMRRGWILPDQPLSKRTRSQNRIFGEKYDPPGLKSVKVAPLKPTTQEEGKAVGAIVVGSTQPDFFAERGSRSEDVKRTLETVSNIAVLSIQNAERYELLEELATTDALTGLYNRRRFFEMMEEEIAEAKRYERPLSLLMTDIDHFKSVNDTYGHPMGDEVLMRVARVLNELARTTDRVCRIGGEEFAIILPETDKIGARMLAERFRMEIANQTFRHEGTEFSISLSLGICTLPEFARHEQELIHRADQALYHAKNSGRNQTFHYADLKTPQQDAGSQR